MLRPISALLICAWVISPLAARDIHVTPEGEGKLDGFDWKNAIAGTHLDDVINKTAGPGDRILLGGGSYDQISVTISAGGAAGQPKELVRMDLGSGPPLLTGKWNPDSPAKGSTAIRIDGGVSHLTIRNIRIKRHVMGIHLPAAPDAPRTDLVFENIRMEEVRHGFFLEDAKDLRFADCVVKRYTKHGFRFEQGCGSVKLARCIADCSEGDPAWETKTELFPFGYFLNGNGRPNAGFVFEDCLAANHMMPLQKKKYKNGDGFVTESNCTEVSFTRCRAIRNQDGGFDLKSPDVTLTGCVALRNPRAFRIWYTGKLENCFAGWGDTGLWNNGGPVQASRCTFHRLGHSAVLTDDGSEAGVILTDCLVTATKDLSRKTSKGGIKAERTVVLEDPAEAGLDVPAGDWDGLGDALNSRRDPRAGYIRQQDK